MSDYNDLLALVRSEVPAAPDTIILRDLRRAVATFTRLSHSWVEERQLAVAAGQASVEVDAAGDFFPVAIRGALWNGRPIGVADSVDIFSAGEQPASLPRTVGIDMISDRVVLFPAPKEAGTLTVQLVQAATGTAPDLPQYIGRAWQNAIVAGALATLKAQPDKPWFDPAGAAVAEGRFNEGIFEARRRSTGTATRTVRPRRWL